MEERCSFRLTKKSWAAYANLKAWCMANRVPMGRMLNAALQAMDKLPYYHQMGQPKHAIVDIKYPKQSNIDDQIRYKKRTDLTRVKTSDNNE